MYSGIETNSVQLVYKVTKELKSYIVYELDYSFPSECILTTLIRIERFRGYSNATNVEYYLKTRDTDNWSKCKYITGLKSTESKNIYYGDHITNGKKSLMIFEFIEDQKSLIIHYFKDYYPYKQDSLLEVLRNKFSGYYQTIKGSIF